MSADWIALRGVRATGFHGVFEHEKRDGQEFVVDVDLSIDLAPAGSSDDLVDTVDYGGLALAVVARIEGEPFDLIERLASVIADDVLRDARVSEVRVTVHKPQAPVPVPFGDVAVIVARARPPVAVVIAVGANLPRGGSGPAATLAAAVDVITETPGLAEVRSSALFDTDPVGGPDQPTYVNAVVTATTTRPPHDLLRALHDIESRFDRTREVRWGARTLDLDLIQYGDPAAGTDVVSDRPHLTLPHPRAHERAFVLVPWLDIDPAARLRRGEAVVAVADLAATVDGSGVRRVSDQPPPARES